MGAGYTRWFRPGGDIWVYETIGNPSNHRRVSHMPSDIILERFPHFKDKYHIVAKPVWPSKKSFFGLYDPQPVSYFAQAMVDGYTVHKFGEDIYFLQPNRIYISTEPSKDWVNNWYKNYKKHPYVSIDTETQGTWLGLDRKETKVPTVSKQQRFLDAGGSFSKPEASFIDRDNIVIAICYDGQYCKRRPIYRPNMVNHYHPVVKPAVKEVWFVTARTHNFENILQNTDENIWHAARDRKFAIRESRAMVGIHNAYASMADKHLVSTMRYLVAAWKEIQKIVVDNYYAESWAFVILHKKKIEDAKNAPSFYAIILPCWSTLVSEFVERFGSEALTSVLDGN